MWRKILVTILVVILSMISLLAILHLFSFDNNRMTWGVTFNAEYAQYLGLDPKVVYDAILGDLGFKYVRLSAQWNNIETRPGVYDFSGVDWQFDASAARGAKVILAIGQKTPRWPECHIPDWATKLSDVEYQNALAKYMEATVNHYRNHGAVEIWQVENEPFLPFGGNTCRPFSVEQLKNEVAMVRSLDPAHQILVSDSGELSSWSRTAHAGDLFGTTLYRVVWSQFTSYWNYDWVPPLFYRGKLWLNHKDPASAFVLELQGEPWIPNNTVMDTAISEQYRSMDLERLKKNMNFAVRVGLPRTYLWGAEWWYWLKIKGYPEIYEFVRQLRKNG